MDFLDPKKKLRNAILLYSGYFLVAIAIAISTLILLYAAYGFGFGKGGTIIQDGLIYFSSQPNPANIYINGKLSSSSTNTRLTLPAGIYNFQLTKKGYRTWSRTIEIDGGTVVHYDYPLLIPNKLTTTKLKTYSSMPNLATQSPNQQWLVVEEPGSDTNFDLYNLNTPTKAPTQISLPANVVTKPTVSESWQVVAWSNDNQHVLLNHIYDGKNEYVMMDIASPSQSFNLTQTIKNQSYTQISLDNKKYNQYYLYNAPTQTLESIDLSNPATPIMQLKNVLAYDTYNSNTILYATTTGAAAGKVDVDELIGNQNYRIKTFDGGSTYLLNMAGYNGTVYVAAGAANENKVYIYQNPVGQLSSDPKQAPVPSQVLFVTNPNYLSFSDNAQFIVAEGDQQFGVYDIENSHGYNYTTSLPLDSPQTNATWMDGDRLTYVSGGKLVIFDYDHNYQQTLAPATSQFLPFFAPNYKYVYTIAPEANSQAALTQTSLLTPADQ